MQNADQIAANSEFKAQVHKVLVQQTRAELSSSKLLKKQGILTIMAGIALFATGGAGLAAMGALHGLALMVAGVAASAVALAGTVVTYKGVQTHGLAKFQENDAVASHQVAETLLHNTGYLRSAVAEVDEKDVDRQRWADRIQSKRAMAVAYGR